MKLNELAPQTRETLLDELTQHIQELRSQHIHLDMARGKPNAEQTSLSYGLLDCLDSTTQLVDEGELVDNYGCPDGLPSARNLISDLTGVSSEQIIVDGSSSLHLEYDLLSRGVSHGFGGQKPWYECQDRRFICLCPGYDRHFALSEYFGFENVAVEFVGSGDAATSETEIGQPDINRIRELVENDPSVKGMWCCPKFSNPTGVTYSNTTVQALARLKPAAPDFRIFWDNAYAFHPLTEAGSKCSLLNIFDACETDEQRERIFWFGSMSKATFPGSGLAWLISSGKTLYELQDFLHMRHVSPEKISQFAHTRFFKSAQDVHQHMQKHRAILEPRFALVNQRLTEALGAYEDFSWSKPDGGYFVSFAGPSGCAQAIVKKAAELGVVLTAAGSTWPGGYDPYDRDIRLAPSYPSLKDLDKALEVFVVAALWVALQQC